MRAAICILFSVFLLQAEAQNQGTLIRFSIGVDGGGGASYTDKYFMLNTQAAFMMNYRITGRWSVQLAPRYTWLVKWNEHYLTLPLHLRISTGERFGIYAGPALVLDIGYFRDWGFSAGIYYNLSERSALNLLFYTFTLYDYNIDYLYIPIGLTFSYTILYRS